MPHNTHGFGLLQGTFKENTQIAKDVAAMAPYGEWLKSSHRLKEMNASTYRQEPAMESAELLKLQAANGEHSGMMLLLR